MSKSVRMGGGRIVDPEDDKHPAGKERTTMSTTTIEADKAAAVLRDDRKIAAAFFEGRGRREDRELILRGLGIVQAKDRQYGIGNISFSWLPSDKQKVLMDAAAAVVRLADGPPPAEDSDFSAEQIKWATKFGVSLDDLKKYANY